ncbi:hypothetical protein CP533_2803 [Ophiocordyceps camponoti-saundersi (nom. inval.)]|nr:hypothetical protein CP533_2803 [Ophiocordyceps camponoti-saundersi (nom. inval.)]
MSRFAFILLIVYVEAIGRTFASMLRDAGHRVAISHWNLQSSSLIHEDLSQVSLAGHNTSNWHHVEASRCTIMGCLLVSGIYNDSDLWYSDNLDKLDGSQFSVPWVYRHEFPLSPQQGQHYFIETHGITSKADLYLNGKQIASSETQAGSFGGHTYDITGVVSRLNAVAVVARPGDFRYDLIQGFVDWNPSPPDNLTGVWRDIHVKQTGSVRMGSVSVSIDGLSTTSATVILRAKAENLEEHEVRLLVLSRITDPSGRDRFFRAAMIDLLPNGSSLIELSHKVNRPKIWWPRQWGEQPLYTSELVFLVDSKVSDLKRETFGIRTVTSSLNKYNDTIFKVNGQPFQVLGGGYAPDQFLRWDKERFLTIARYVLDMGLNTIRLEGMLEHPELYEIADELGIMVMAGWTCCSKWEAWKYNSDLMDLKPFPYWVERDYEIAAASMRHEAAMLQKHPSILAFLVGSDWWPDDRATEIYVETLQGASWQTPIIASASKRGYPEMLGPSGLKMEGPYDWVPPNYWFDMEDRLGAAFGFGSELGSGVGTPEYGSLTKFLSPTDLDDLWMRPERNLFHMSPSRSPFANRSVYNRALFARYGRPKSLRDYLLKSQMMDYEATRSQHEAYASRWNAERPATGSIYWMLNNAWPSLHWSLFDYAMHPAGAYYGVKTACRLQHVVYDYVDRSVWIVNRSLDRKGGRTIAVDLIDLNGTSLYQDSFRILSHANTAAKVGSVSSGMKHVNDVALLRLLLYDDQGKTLSRNVYWLSKENDALDWARSAWYFTPVSKYADLRPLLNQAQMENTSRQVSFAINSSRVDEAGQRWTSLDIVNRSLLPAFFIRVRVINDDDEEDITPVFWSENYVTLWPYERLRIEVRFMDTSFTVRVGETEMPDARLGE